VNRVFIIALWLAGLARPVAQPIGGQLMPPGEAICGYAGSFYAMEASRVKQGLSVQLLAGEASVLQPTPLRFRVFELPQESPEKLMHVIGVREDLGAFFHLHPQRAAPGMWETVHKFTDAGRYQIWTDIKRQGVVYSFAHPRFPVVGETLATPRGPIPRLQDRKQGYEISLNLSESEPVAGRTNAFVVIVRDDAGNQVRTDFYLGALMHVVIVKSDLSVYHHAHAKEHWKSGRAVSFDHVFRQPGLYKLFAQFRPEKTTLPPDEAILAEFWVKVDTSPKNANSP
jgi:hypothetical protein